MWGRRRTTKILQKRQQLQYDNINKITVETILEYTMWLSWNNLASFEIMGTRHLKIRID